MTSIHLKKISYSGDSVIYLFNMERNILKIITTKLCENLRKKSKVELNKEKLHKIHIILTLHGKFL